MDYRPTHFKLEELVPEGLFYLMSEKALWNLFTEESLRMLDWMKDKFPEGSIVINDWSWGGVYQYSGFRVKTSSDYSENSPHSTGRGWDLKFSNYKVEDVRKVLSGVKYSPFVRRVELGTSTWLHIDGIVKKGYEKTVYFFNP